MKNVEVSSTGKKLGRGGVVGALAFAALLFISFKWNPLDHIMEANPVAYYQARIAYQRGDNQTRAALHDAVAGGTLSMHSYSKIVFPAFMKTAVDGENLFPLVEAEKGIARLREEALSAIGGRPPE